MNNLEITGVVGGILILLMILFQLIKRMKKSRPRFVIKHIRKCRNDSCVDNWMIQGINKVFRTREEAISYARMLRRN